MAHKELNQQVFDCHKNPWASKSSCPCRINLVIAMEAAAAVTVKIHSLVVACCSFIAAVEIHIQERRFARDWYLLAAVGYTVRY